MKMNKRTLIGGAVLMIIIGFFISKNHRQDNGELTKVISPHYGNLQTVITTTGTVLPKNRLEIKPTVNGRIEQVLVQEGQMVKAGNVLAWMSSTDRAALLDSARGQGEKEFTYWQDVYKPIPLLSPIDGQVIVATTQPGQTVTTSEAIVVLSDRLIVRAQVDETDIGKIMLKQDAVISLDAYPDTKIKAVVDHIYYESKTVNNVTIYDVDLLPQEIPPFFRSGMNANVDFIVQRKEHILLLPATAINRIDDEAFVWLEGKDQKPVKKEIETGMTDDKNIEVISGLRKEDRVIVKTKKFSLNKAKSGVNPFMPSRSSSGNRRSGGSPPPG